ncbi:hypothetical protein SAMN05192583_0116 [Sphingomonas gellani]|uniref:Uncharacterized protein n=1 Tax=Sphingomonas gellani TaxID=1166340 RepID=A0A1H7Y6P6_9SPHN|nr:hypothetical protein [Sphingomonas gellani]SEM41601.1 hypothetical protein SAMN05192583_0116 [Sphingomonas gellani]
MFGASKPRASLSSGLLARKGQARPAMRPQGYASLAGVGGGLEDLGWNDMGSGEGAAVPDVHIAPAPAPAPVTAENADVPVPMPAVLTQREALGEVLGGVVTPAAEEPQPEEPQPEEPRVDRNVSVATAARLARESAQQTKKTGKAAFTLRLDGERHLRLRLASALAGKSAQQLVTHAVDGLLKTLPEVELLVAQLPPARKAGR